MWSGHNGFYPNLIPLSNIIHVYILFFFSLYITINYYKRFLKLNNTFSLRVNYISCWKNKIFFKVNSIKVSTFFLIKKRDPKGLQYPSYFQVHDCRKPTSLIKNYYQIKKKKNRFKVVKKTVCFKCKTLTNFILTRVGLNISV